MNSIYVLPLRTMGAAIVLTVTSLMAQTPEPGVMDSDFGPNSTGIVFAEPMNANEWAMAVDSLDRVIIAVFDTQDERWKVRRYKANGSLDATFSQKFNSNLLPGVGSKVIAIAIDSDNSIVLAGRHDVARKNNINNQYAFTVAKLKHDGSMDTDFGDGGIVHTQIGKMAFPKAVVIKSDGKIIVVGESTNDRLSSKSVRWYTTLVQYRPDGRLDTDSFGADAETSKKGGGKKGGGNGGTKTGIYIDDFELETHGGWGVFNLSLAPGSSAAGGPLAVSISVKGASETTPKFFIARYGDDGKPDTAFGTAGRVEVTRGATWRVHHQADGKLIYLSEESDNNGSFGTLTRLKVDGGLDLTFGGTGTVTYRDPVSVNLFADFDIEASGEIMVAHQAVVNGVRFVSMLRFKSTGDLDSSFGSGGVSPVSIEFANTLVSTFVQSLALTADKVVFYGYGLVPNDELLVLGRMHL